MTAASLALTQDTAPGVLDACDSTIPDRVSTHFADYDKTVSVVVPVIGLSREEWWLFDAEGLLLDVLCCQA